MNHKSLFTIFILLIGSFCSVNLKADVNQGITLTPTGIDVSLKTEQEFSGFFTIRNNESQDLALEIKEADMNNGLITNQQDLDWFVVNTIPGVIAANSELNIEYSLKVPANVASNSYTKAIVVKFISVSEKLSSFNLSMPYVANIYVQSLFNSETGTIISEFYADTKFVFENRIDISLKVANATNSAFSRPLINISIINPTGNIVYSSVLNESLSLLKESKNYKINTDWPNINLLDLGQYTAQVLVTDTITNKATVQSFTFLNLNYLYLILILVTIVGALLLLKFAKGLVEIVKVNKDLQDNKGIGIKRQLQKRSAK